LDLSLNNNLISSLRPAIQVLGKCFPNLAILSLIGNPFHKMLHAPVQMLHYRLEVISRVSKLRILDHAAVSEEERRQARRGERSDAGGSMEEKVEGSKKLEEKNKLEESNKLEAEQNLRMDGRGGKEESDGLMGRLSSGSGSKVQQEGLQGKAGGLPQPAVELKGNQERTETAMEATEGQSGDHTTILTTSRRKSKGIRSEGNRFIQNWEL